MKLIAGLGNPGKRYVNTRHNVGFLVIEELARRWGVATARYDRQFEGLVAQTERAGQQVLLLQPQTFMNLCGHSVGSVWRYYKLALADLLVIMDDLDLPLGQLRVRAAGSAGGHKGLTDVIRHLQSDEFARLRIGIGKVHPAATVEYVLSAFEPQERERAAEAVSQAADAAECWLARGLEAVMNEYNRKRSSPSGPEQTPADGPAKGDES